MSPGKPSERSQRSRSRSPRAPTFVPLHPHVGARVEGVDVTQVSDQQVAEVFGPALEKYGLLLFPAQSKLSPPQFFRFLRSFPDVDQEELNGQLNPFAQKDPSCLPEMPTVRALGTKNSSPDLHRGATPETNEMGCEWHTDGCGITGLYAAEVPAESPKRSTLWVSGCRAYDMLDSATKEKAKSLQLHFSPRHTMEASVAEIWRRGGRMARNGLKLLTPVPKEQLTPEQVQKRENTTNPRSADGLSDCEARDALEQLLLPGTSGDAVYVHEWSPGDFVVWDNRSTLHSATDIIDAPQLMYQTFLRTKTPMKTVD